MKKFNKLLALGLASASLVTGGFMLSGCDIDRDNNNTQTEQNQDEQKVVSSISLNTNTLPSYIIRGKFSRTNITMTVTYEDDTTKVVDVTESMFSETDKTKLNTVGQYNLTVNYGDKTATMYANVVDERYLLKEVVEANLDKDVTVTSSEGIMKYDAENKILHYTEGEDYTFWGWINNNLFYTNESDEDGSNKWLSGTIYDYINSEYPYSKIVDMFKRTDAWTIDDIEKDGLNYILTATHGDDEQYKYYFNEDFMYKVEETDGGYVYTSTYNYSILNLEVPAEIKALESGTTVDVESITWDLKDLMNNYLESDFEMSIFDNASNTTYLYQQYDANNKIIKEIDPTDDNEGDLSWINGDYYYAYYYATNSIYKYNISSWDRHIMVNCFTFDHLFDANNITVDISEGGQYYELILPSEDGDGEVWEYKYIFNAEEISKIEVRCNNQYMGHYTYNKTNVVLEVPAEIKALESSTQ